ncbi:hypothetical protein [Paraclostridium sp. AKS73]|uniref:hypothetical protein n=1 Tax=Paraclostridium sp. AKS73 TaxID=2876116 RepID=UPI0021DFA9DF|nr:hypothetical protein [Paraclostridium sp. AKS73]MCU9815821.1 hypothetical protein [Paraclostridium sp. AKS73]
MLFNDFVRNLDEQYEELNKLEDIIADFNEILDLEKDWIEKCFKFGYLGLIDQARSSSPTSSANKLAADTVNYFNILREKLICIDFLEFGATLGKINIIGDELLSKETDEMVMSLKKSYKTIHEYKKYRDDNDRVDKYCESMDAIRLTVSTFNKFKYTVNYIKSINNKLCNEFEGEGLEIQLLNHGISKDTYSKVVDPVYVIYDKLCEIANIKEELVIARVETGSLFAKFAGNASILKLVEKIIGTVHDIGVRNLTREGKKKNLVESTDLFKDHFNILKEMESMGMDVSEPKEIANETLVILMKQSNILLTASPDIRINEKTLSKSEDVKKLLAKQDYKLLAVATEED